VCPAHASVWTVCCTINGVVSCRTSTPAASPDAPPPCPGLTILPLLQPRWCDIFDLFPTLLLRLPLAMFFQLAPALKPRYYSISSSSAVTPSEVAVTVGLLAYKLPSGQQRTGFCSSYLTSLRPGDRVRFKLISQPAFRQPLNLEAPVVWVAAGTGLAPFRVGCCAWGPWRGFPRCLLQGRDKACAGCRACGPLPRQPGVSVPGLPEACTLHLRLHCCAVQGFWEERLLRLQQGQPLGPAMLVFGCRSTEKDFICELLCPSPAVPSGCPTQHRSRCLATRHTFTVVAACPEDAAQSSRQLVRPLLACCLPVLQTRSGLTRCSRRAQ
jgi:hypothetical protein